MEAKESMETSTWKPTLHIVSWSMTALDEAGEDRRVIRAKARFQIDVNLFSAMKTEPDRDISKIPVQVILKCAEISADPQADENRKKELGEQNGLAGAILALEGPQTPIGYLTYSPTHEDIPLADEEFIEIVIGLRPTTFDSLWAAIRDKHPPTEMGLLVTRVPVSSRSAMHATMKWDLGADTNLPITRVGISFASDATFDTSSEEETSLNLTSVKAQLEKMTAHFQSMERMLRWSLIAVAALLVIGFIRN